jgi:hypothetical protein
MKTLITSPNFHIIYPSIKLGIITYTPHLIQISTIEDISTMLTHIHKTTRSTHIPYAYILTDTGANYDDYITGSSLKLLSLLTENSLTNVMLLIVEYYNGTILPSYTDRLKYIYMSCKQLINDYIGCLKSIEIDKKNEQLLITASLPVEETSAFLTGGTDDIEDELPIQSQSQSQSKLSTISSIPLFLSSGIPSQKLLSSQTNVLKSNMQTSKKKLTPQQQYLKYYQGTTLRPSEDLSRISYIWSEIEFVTECEYIIDGYIHTHNILYLYFHNKMKLHQELEFEYDNDDGTSKMKLKKGEIKKRIKQVQSKRKHKKYKKYKTSYKSYLHIIQKYYLYQFNIFFLYYIVYFRNYFILVYGSTFINTYLFISC